MRKDNLEVDLCILFISSASSNAPCRWRGKKDQRNFFYLPFIFLTHGHISVVAMCIAKNGALKTKEGVKMKRITYQRIIYVHLVFLGYLQGLSLPV